MSLVRDSLEHRIQRIDQLIDLTVRDRQWRAQLDVVAILAEIGEAVLRRERPPGRAVGDELDAPQQAAAADFADDVMALRQLVQLLLQIGPNLSGAGEQALARHDFVHLEADEQRLINEGGQRRARSRGFRTPEPLPALRFDAR